MKRIAALAIVLVAAAMVFAGGAQESAAAPAEKKSSITIGEAITYATLSPFQLQQQLGTASLLLYEHLGDRDGDEVLHLNLASSYKEIEAGKVYEITIHDNIYDTAGNHITAEDVAYCYTSFKPVDTAQLYESMVATGEYTCVLTLSKVALGFFEDAMGKVPVVSKKAYEASPDGMSSNPVSTSHYIKSDYVPGASLSFVRNENYWQKDESKYGYYAAAGYEEIKYVTITESAQMTVALETGSIDAMNGLASTEVPKFQDGGMYAGQFNHTIVADTVISLYMSGTSNSAVANDVNLRKAIAYAINAEGCLKSYTGGNVGIVSECFGRSSASDAPSYYKEEGGYFKYNLEKAKEEYLAASGYKGETIRFLGATAFSKISQVIEYNLQQIGINVETSLPDLALYFAAYADPTQWDIAICVNGCAYNSEFISKQYGKTPTRHGWTDPELVALAALTNTFAGHTEENILALNRALDEKVYARSLFETGTICVYSKSLGISEPVMTNSGSVAYWASI